MYVWSTETGGELSDIFKMIFGGWKKILRREEHIQC